MAVSHRVTGTWAELTADGSVAIPATPQAGDRMYLFARWKDFSVTATVANWTELTEFADGSTSSGNGTGSVKVGCWYRDWQPGDTDPTIDFSASPNSASVVITVMSKGADDVWLTPVARTAAMTNWTTTLQSVSASATVTVPSSGVVIGLIGIRDDTATMTRPTNGVDDSGGLVTWNGNHVESPATHHSTTTGDDGAADLGYRLVTTGAAGATLRLTGTISAAETGTGLWVVQGVSMVVTPSIMTLTVTRFAASLLLVLTPATASLVTTTFVSQLRETTTPVTTGLTTATFTPSLREGVAPPIATLVVTAFTTQLQETLIPASVSLTVASFAPLLVETATPASVNFSLSTFSPAVVTLTTVTVSSTALTITATSPHILPFRAVYIDPGGDAVQAIGYFNSEPAGSTGDVTFDNTEWVVGVGSYKFDSGVSGLPAYLRVPAVLGSARRVSAYFWYDSLPDVVESATEFAIGGIDYSGGGFDNSGNLQADDGLYETATPAQNDGQGSVFSAFGFDVPDDAQILSVKIIYERSYDAVGGPTSIGISRVKWRVNGEEGPDHDNTDMPVTDTVVEVDVTSDIVWEPQHLTDLSFEVIAEARRGNTVIPHTQSWDYVKVVVEHRPATTIMAGYEGEDIAFSLALAVKDSYSVVRFTEGQALDGSRLSYDGITKLLPDVKNRISFAYVSNGSDNLDIKVYVNGIEELTIEGSKTNGWAGDSNLDLYYGWIHTPGESHVAWFDQLYVDDGDDLTDCGNMRSTAKLPASTNENEWNTTSGTGAVSEQPLSETNFRQETRAIAFRQTYTLQDVATGDVDLTGKTLIGYMPWVWAKRGTGGTSESLALIGNGVEVMGFNTVPITLTTTPAFYRTAVTSTTYPSDAAGVGMVSNDDSADTFMYETGVVVAYEGPANPDILLPRQEVVNETLDTIVDDLRAAPPDSYEVCCAYDDFEGAVEIKIYVLYSEGGEFQQQPSLNSKGRLRIDPGIEVRLDVTVSGATNLQIWRRLNVD